MELLNFGRFKGKTLQEIPTDYLYWLLMQAVEDVETPGNYQLATEVRAELLTRDKAGRGHDYLAGTRAPKETAYVLSWNGSTHLISVHESLADALRLVERFVSLQFGPDVPKDVVAVWEVQPTGEKTVVWVCAAGQFIRAYGGVQGKLPGHAKTLFFEARQYAEAA